MLGPPPRPGDAGAGARPAAAPVTAPRPTQAAAGTTAPPPAASDGCRRRSSRRPTAALLEPAPGFDGGMLPRIGPDGRMPMQVYAAAFDAADKRPRVAVLLAGIGMAEIDSEEAIRATPAAVSLAISPYAPRPGRLLEIARATGHETLISIPMEPLGYPLNDAGNHALLTGAAAGAEPGAADLGAVAHRRLCRRHRRRLSGLRGERFAAGQQMMPGAGRAGRARPAVCRSAPGAAAARRSAAGASGRAGGRRGDRRAAGARRDRGQAGAAGADGARPRQRARRGRAARAGHGRAAGRLGGDAGHRAASRWCR